MSDRGVTPQEAMARLDGHSIELGELSSALFEINKRLDEVEGAYQDSIDAYKVGLYLQSQVEDGPKLPAIEMQDRLARRAMDPEQLGRRDGLIRKRERIRQRIADVKAMVEADRSILSALKAEMDATSSSLRRAA